MNDEIKEILEHIKLYPEKMYCLSEKEKIILLDYITNLQQENEYLKKHQRFHKKFGSDYIFCVEGDKETYKDMVLEKQEEIEQLQQKKI